jgi:hypothetical protein
MQHHYSTVAGEEVRAGLAKVISLAGLTPTRKARGGDRCGEMARPTQRRKVEGGELVGITQANQVKSGDPGGDRGGSLNESGAEVGKKTA